MLLSLSLLFIICNLVINFISGQSANNNRSIISKACACYNQGICDPVTSSCICPSGFLGQQCERLECFHGDYCERQRVATRCTDIRCQNGGICYEHSPAISVFAYCLCPPGFTGRFCETEYFRCSQPGVFADLYQCAQSSYFLCDHTNRLLTGTCPKGLRFNLNKMSCDHASSVTCSNI
ncbi:unnamed protein product [Rotaria sp. Silwood1]|nr:unnamed protein product [Rotaria sp. Silwood1]CAF4595957.1 unnamed protein product [Rotaria sp. Silwood1]